MNQDDINERARTIQRLAHVAARDARTDIGVELLAEIQHEAKAIEAARKAVKARWENR